MANVYEKMKELGIQLPKPGPAGGIYTPVMEFGSNLLYMSGCGPQGETTFEGKLGADLTLEEGQQAARNCILNLLANLVRVFSQSRFLPPKK